MDLDRTLVALADPTRRGVVDLLRSRPRRAGELALALETSPPAMSRHLRLLREGGLVQEARDETDSRARVFQLRKEPFEELRTWLDEVEALWTGELGSFKAHAEKTRKRARAR